MTTNTNTCPPRFYAVDRPNKTPHERACDNLRMIESCLERSRWRWAHYLPQHRVPDLADPVLTKLVDEYGKVQDAHRDAFAAFRKSGNSEISCAERDRLVAAAAEAATRIDYQYDTVVDVDEDFAL